MGKYAAQFFLLGKADDSDPLDVIPNSFNMHDILHEN